MKTLLEFPFLYVVVDLDYVGDEQQWLRSLGEVAEAAAGKPVAIQVRAKGAMTEALAAQARARVPDDVPLVLNGDSAFARRLGYHAVQWPEAAIPHASGPRSRHHADIHLASVHSVAAARRAERAGADALVFGAVFPPGSKTAVPAGVEALAVVAAATTLPVLAIGGVTPERVAACLSAGARGVAVISGVLAAASAARAIEHYLAAIQAYEDADHIEESVTS